MVADMLEKFKLFDGNLSIKFNFFFAYTHWVLSWKSLSSQGSERSYQEIKDSKKNGIKASILEIWKQSAVGS